MKILITGASGTIGQVVMAHLSKEHECIGIDVVPSENVTALDIAYEPERVRELLNGVDAVIHLAWDVREAGVSLKPAIPANKEMTETMYALSLEQGVKRFILASSVHVSFGHINFIPGEIVADHQTLHEKHVSLDDAPFPLGTYGASKVYLEALGKAYSAKGLPVVAVRFGNVTPDDGFGEYPFWLSHRDCGNFIERCIEAHDLPPFSIFYAISNNPCNPFDLAPAQTELGYDPQDSSTCPIE